MTQLKRIYCSFTGPMLWVPLTCGLVLCLYSHIHIHKQICVRLAVLLSRRSWWWTASLSPFRLKENCCSLGVRVLYGFRGDRQPLLFQFLLLSLFCFITNEYILHHSALHFFEVILYDCFPFTNAVETVCRYTELTLHS